MNTRTATLPRRALALSALVVATLGLVATGASAAPSRHTPAAGKAVSRSFAALGTGRVHYAINVPACAKPKNPNGIRCFAMRRVDVPKGTPGAFAYRERPTYEMGPAGGFTPNDLATAYGFDPTTVRHNQLIAIIDWYDDPEVLSDLNHFDAHYGFPKETKRTFLTINQNGRTSPLPKTKSHEGSIEITLDVQSARAVCRTCPILLIEANGPSDADLAKSENLAAALGASEISNSFGEPERKSFPKSVINAYNHPGVVITVSTGDQGWFGWDFANNPSSKPQHHSQNAASFPSVLPTVVAVGGTELALNDDGTKLGEVVWNEDGIEDANGFPDFGSQGATGGGCSKYFKAKPWQKNFPGYSDAGCNGGRLAADVSAVADPATGFDIYDTFAGEKHSWLTIGGTSLSAPVTAAMYALAGGGGGAAYPASSLYTNAIYFPTSVYDVVPVANFPSGSGFCGGATTNQCGADVYTYTQNQTHNPNALGGGIVDCSFPHKAANDPPSPPPLSSECNTVTGYDGPTGLGTPNSLQLFKHSNPKLTISGPATVHAHSTTSFTADVVESIAGLHAVSYSWKWGDGKSTSVASSSNTVVTPHKYTKGGTYIVTLSVYDNAHQQSLIRVQVPVK